MDSDCYFAFAAIDPFVAVDYGVRFLGRAGSVLLLWPFCLVSHYFAAGAKIGAVLCTLTGFVVTVLTQMAGGPQSNYWTMLMLVFGTVSLLPSPTLWAAVIMTVNIVFISWMTLLLS